MVEVINDVKLNCQNMFLQPTVTRKKNEDTTEEEEDDDDDDDEKEQSKEAGERE